MIVDQSFFLPLTSPLERSTFVPIVRDGCICTNGGKPDDHGLIYVSPQCIVHGIRSRSIDRPAQLDISERVAGIIHGPRSERGSNRNRLI